MTDRPTRHDPARRQAPAPWEAVPAAAPGQGYPARCLTAGDYWYDRGAESAGAGATFGARAWTGAE
ncbi:hypothetical protein [Streptomyces sp. NBC_01353]|uniref:hypothetical protein n=1 Tax=Streptomyces sp. NBC_01353 TaxID=2903835 RepID=UPI002E3781DA|nr:hypothetical protein [Streptomyces sp. NBC_01353]